MSLKDEGSVTFWARHPDQSWLRNDSGYDFGTLVFDDIKVHTVKHPDHTIDVVVSGPSSRTFRLSAKAILSNEHPDLFVALTWTHQQVLLYLQGVQVAGQSLIPIDLSRLEITLDDGTPHIPNELVEQTFAYLFEVFNTISAFTEGYDAQITREVLQSGLDKSKFQIVSTREGSFVAIWNGAKTAFVFVKNNLAKIFITLYQKGDRLTDVMIQQKQAEADEKTAQADIAREKANQEKITTFEKYVDLCRKSGIQLIAHSPLPPDETRQVIDEKFTKPLEQLGQLLLANRTSLSITDVPIQLGNRP